MTPAERTLRGRIGAYAMLARNDIRETSKAGRDAAWQRFVDQVDPERVLPEVERARRAEAARRSHMAAIALKSVQARSRKRGDRAAVPHDRDRGPDTVLDRDPRPATAAGPRPNARDFGPGSRAFGTGTD